MFRKQWRETELFNLNEIRVLDVDRPINAGVEQRLDLYWGQD